MGFFYIWDLGFFDSIIWDFSTFSGFWWDFFLYGIWDFFGSFRGFSVHFLGSFLSESHEILLNMNYNGKLHAPPTEI